MNTFCRFLMNWQDSFTKTAGGLSEGSPLSSATPKSTSSAKATPAIKSTPAVTPVSSKPSVSKRYSAVPIESFSKPSVPPPDAPSPNNLNTKSAPSSDYSPKNLAAPQVGTDPSVVQPPSAKARPNTTASVESFNKPPTAPASGPKLSPPLLASPRELPPGESQPTASTSRPAPVSATPPELPDQPITTPAPPLDYVRGSRDSHGDTQGIFMETDPDFYVDLLGDLQIQHGRSEFTDWRPPPPDQPITTPAPPLGFINSEFKDVPALPKKRFLQTDDPEVLRSETNPFGIATPKDKPPTLQDIYAERKYNDLTEEEVRSKAEAYARRDPSYSPPDPFVSSYAIDSLRNKDGLIEGQPAFEDFRKSLAYQADKFNNQLKVHANTPKIDPNSITLDQVNQAYEARLHDKFREQFGRPASSGQELEDAFNPDFGKSELTKLREKAIDAIHGKEQQLWRGAKKMFGGVQDLHKNPLSYVSPVSPSLLPSVLANVPDDFSLTRNGVTDMVGENVGGGLAATLAGLGSAAAGGATMGVSDVAEQLGVNPFSDSFGKDPRTWDQTLGLVEEQAKGSPILNFMKNFGSPVSAIRNAATGSLQAGKDLVDSHFEGEKDHQLMLDNIRNAPKAPAMKPTQMYDKYFSPTDSGISGIGNILGRVGAEINRPSDLISVPADFVGSAWNTGRSALREAEIARAHLERSDADHAKFLERRLSSPIPYGEHRDDNSSNPTIPSWRNRFERGLAEATRLFPDDEKRRRQWLDNFIDLEGRAVSLTNQKATDDLVKTKARVRDRADLRDMTNGNLLSAFNKLLGN